MRYLKTFKGFKEVNRDEFHHYSYMTGGIRFIEYYDPSVESGNRWRFFVNIEDVKQLGEKKLTELDSCMPEEEDNRREI